MNVEWRLVRTTAELLDLLSKWPGDLVADVETYRTDPLDGKLLGVALAPLEPVVGTPAAAYVVLQEYDFRTSTWTVSPSYADLKVSLQRAERWLVGHNHTYDRAWLGGSWRACTRIMWHLASAPKGPRPYGLKDAQVEVLGWPRKGSKELEEQVKARGGSLSKGDHCLADVETLAKYACLDAYSTAELFRRLTPFFDRHDYWWMLERMTRYAELLDSNTRSGVAVDEDRLAQVKLDLEAELEAQREKFLKELSGPVRELEADWLAMQVAKLKLPSAVERLRGDESRHPKLKLSSDKQKRELFYDVLGLPVCETTDSGLPSTSADAVKLAVRDSGRASQLDKALKAYLAGERCDTLLCSFVKPWLSSVRSGRVHPRYNVCGTVSYRLSGFKPYFLNLPFDEKEVVGVFRCDPGYVGVHADLAAIEPTLTAHYSQDPGLLKVFRDGLGDVYLDLALTLFPGDVSLREGYDPDVPVTTAVKEHFKKQRKVAKIVQLAVQYTGTGHTVAKQLNKAGMPTTVSAASEHVSNYWVKYRRVAEFNAKLFTLNRRQGYLRNAVGRIIRVPDPEYKDLPNRFVQSSAHDVLVWWVQRIYQLCEERGITVKPVLLDCHDSTTAQCPSDQVEQLEQAYRDALAQVNEELGLSVPAKAELKRWHTLAGLKGEE